LRGARLNELLELRAEKKMLSVNISVTTPLQGSSGDGISKVLHQPSSIHLIPAGTALVDSPLGLGIRSPPHNDSVAYVCTCRCLIQPAATANLSSQNPKIYAILKKMPNKILGGVLDSGAQRGATGQKSEILKHTGTSLLMQPAVGPAKHMTGILTGTETQDSHRKPFVLVVPDVPVYDPAMSDSLIPVGRLIAAGFTVNHRIPSQANEDGFSLKAVPLYGGTITTPDGKTTIVMEYAQHTWRLPLPSNKRFSKPELPPRATSEIFVDLRSTGSSFIDTSHSFHMLDKIDDADDEGYVPAYLTQDRIEGRFQQRYEVMLQRREMAGIYHTSHGHCNNRQTVLNLQAKGIECNQLKRYILAHKCDACDAALGRRHHKVKATKKAKRKTKSIPKTAAPVTTAVAPAFDSQNPYAEQLDLESSTITDAIDPIVTITESLARLFQHSSKNPSDYPDITQMRNMSDTAKDPTHPGIGEGATTVKVLQQALIVQHHFSHHLALICAWIGGMPAV